MGLANAVLIRLARVLICWYSELMNKTTGKCNEFSMVWAAIYGCVGVGAASGSQPGNFSRMIRKFTCPVCAAVVAADKANPRGRTARLVAAQTAAGVSNYRFQSASWINGRPVLG